MKIRRKGQTCIILPTTYVVFRVRGWPILGGHNVIPFAVTVAASAVRFHHILRAFGIKSTIRISEATPLSENQIQKLKEEVASSPNYEHIPYNDALRILCPHIGI